LDIILVLIFAAFVKSAIHQSNTTQFRNSQFFAKCNVCNISVMFATKHILIQIEKYYIFPQVVYWM